MKKKLKDVTLAEMYEVCSTQDTCLDCPVFKACSIEINIEERFLDEVVDILGEEDEEEA